MIMIIVLRLRCLFFFFNDTATTEIYTLSLHDALPIFAKRRGVKNPRQIADRMNLRRNAFRGTRRMRVVKRSEEHTSELQSRLHLVCRLLLEKKKTLNYMVPLLIVTSWPQTATIVMRTI